MFAFFIVFFYIAYLMYPRRPSPLSYVSFCCISFILDYSFVSFSSSLGNVTQLSFISFTFFLSLSSSFSSFLFHPLPLCKPPFIFLPLPLSSFFARLHLFLFPSLGIILQYIPTYSFCPRHNFLLPASHSTSFSPQPFASILLPSLAVVL